MILAEVCRFSSIFTFLDRSTSSVVRCQYFLDMFGFEDNIFEKYFFGSFCGGLRAPSKPFFRSPDRILVIFPLFSSLAKKIEAPDGTSASPDRKSQNRSSVRWIYVWVGYIPKISSIGALTGSPAYTARSWLIFLAPKPVFLMFY